MSISQFLHHACERRAACSLSGGHYRRPETQDGRTIRENDCLILQIFQMEKPVKLPFHLECANALTALIDGAIAVAGGSIVGWLMRRLFSSAWPLTRCRRSVVR
jgi:hypothetical protein